MDLEKPREIDAVRIAWTKPYARFYQMQYWRGADAMDSQANDADPDNPPLKSTMHGTPGSRYMLPAASLTVLSGAVTQK
jgi:hypothetical protein